MRFDLATNAESVVGTAKAVCNRSGTINKLDSVGQLGSGKEDFLFFRETLLALCLWHIRIRHLADDKC